MDFLCLGQALPSAIRDTTSCGDNAVLSGPCELFKSVGFVLSILCAVFGWTLVFDGFRACGFLHWTSGFGSCSSIRCAVLQHAWERIAALTNLKFSRRKQTLQTDGRRKQFLAPTLGCPLFRVLWFVVLFDSTCGFPGEGPDAQFWSLLSANVGSLHANKTWKTWDDDVLAVQETRLGRNNFRSARFDVESTGKGMFHGELLPGLITSHGIRRTPHGGVAILSPSQLTKPFDPKEDSTGHYHELFKSKRVVACWVQILPTTRLLLVNVYAQTAAASDSRVRDYNDLVFQKIFEVIAQFGDIPAIIVGDFQDVPDSYHTISHAIRFHGWCDPFTVADANGDLVRNITFSNDRTFSGDAEGCSSIDGILTNKVSTAALRSAEILETFHSQHRPLQAKFNWKKIFQTGFVLKQPAPFQLTKEAIEAAKSGRAQEIAELLWHTHDGDAFRSAANAEDKWRQANNFCINTLVQMGAKWMPGQASRGDKPCFQQKKVCPGQTPSGQAKTLTLAWQQNALRSISELRRRFSRTTFQGPDRCDLLLTCARLRRRLVFLGYPELWPHHMLPTLLELHLCELWLLHNYHKNENMRKLSRIHAWKASVRESAKTNHRFIFRHLRFKTKDEPANLVEDVHGNIIFDPQEALFTINEKWDNVFSANVLHEKPAKMLQVIWPYIQDFTQQASVPPIEAEHLFQTVQMRNPDAAPGLDGWRTRELQLLPVVCFSPFAEIFRQLETDDQELPDAITYAKQLILNKNGSSDAMQKRLITVLPIMLLAYSGARFRHLQEWQHSFLPFELYGGIKNRQMSEVHTGLQLSLDQAKQNGDSLIGVKLDKSKCFDRIIPTYAGALMLSFGVPKQVINIFLKIYAKLQRFLSYKSWTSPKPTHAPNGVAQGCSLSLLAINMYMCTWVLMIRKLPELTARVFIDDSYLWTTISNKHLLVDAIRVTCLWDELSGQKLNLDKCTVWGSDCHARRSVKSLFPQMHFASHFDVLGTLIITDNKLVCHLSESKITKIEADCKNIGLLPLDLKAKTKLLGSKVLPQATYGPCINQIPKTVQNRICSGVVTALWKNRPHWRSKRLVIALLSKPHRVDVCLSKAYLTLLDFIRFLKFDLEIVSTCKALFHAIPNSKSNLMRNVVEAANVFGFSVDKELRFSFHGSQPVFILDVHPKDFKRLLQMLARNASYHSAQTKTRKDFFKPTGVLDFDLTRCSTSKLALENHGRLSSNTILDSVQTGCLLTNDRLCAAGLVEDSLCRFCHKEKESAYHLVHTCDTVSNLFGRPPLHDLGPNFPVLGIVEHPLGLAKARMAWSDPHELHVKPITVHNVSRPLWTDGSVLASNLFWLTTGAFAIVDLSGFTIAKGQVNHWSLCSFSTELWAILVAVALADSSVIIFTDNKAVATNFAIMLETQGVPAHWSHFYWWAFLLDLIDRKFEKHGAFVQVQWIPAHKLENIPVELIGDELARAVGSTVLDIENNRKADLVARDVCKFLLPVNPDWLTVLPQLITDHHRWLIQIARAVGQDNEEDQVKHFVPKEQIEPEVDDVFIQNYFKVWTWPPHVGNTLWKSPLTDPVLPPRNWKDAPEDWNTFCLFASSLTWRIDKNCCWSYLELAAIFILRGFRLVGCDDQTTSFNSVIPRIKKLVTVTLKSEVKALIPGKHNPDYNKPTGKTLPSGVLEGVELCCSQSELLSLGRFILDGGNHRLASWSACLCDLN